MKIRLGLAVVAAAALVAATAPVGASSSLPTHEVRRAASSQPVDRLHLQEAATRFSDHWSDPGYGGVQIDPQNDTIIVKWAGPVPDPVRQQADQPPPGVTVDLVGVPYSEEQLTQTAADVVADAIRRGDHDLVDVAGTSDNSGLVAHVTRGTASANAPGAAVRTYATASHGVPVRMETISWGHPVPLSRHNSAAPWKGGAEIHVSGEYCTSGFAMLTSSGAGRLLTAAHCGASGATVTDGVGESIGPVVSRQRDTTDSELIDPSASPATIGVVFAGPWNATSLNSRYQLNVGGSSAPSTGESVCDDGMMSGEHCNRTITATAVSWACGGTNTCVGFHIGDYTSTTSVAGANGDSGGPVYVNRSDGKVGARGMIEYGGNPTACGSTAYTTTCYNDIYAIGITHITSQWGVTVETN